jgi:hypothetical protein
MYAAHPAGVVSRQTSLQWLTHIFFRATFRNQQPLKQAE